MVLHSTATTASVMLTFCATAYATASVAISLGALLIEPDALHALIGIVVAQGGVLGENIVERLVAVAVAEAVEHLFAVLLRVNIPVHERLQRGDYLAGIRRGQQASAKQCDDDGQRPAIPPIRPRL